MLDSIAEVVQYVDPDGYELFFLNDPDMEKPDFKPLVVNKTDMPPDPSRRGFKQHLSKSVL